MTGAPALFVIGHGTRDEAGVSEFRRFLAVVQEVAPDLTVAGGFIELASPDLDTALDDLVASGRADGGIVAVVDGTSVLDNVRVEHNASDGIYVQAASTSGVATIRNSVMMLSGQAGVAGVLPGPAGSLTEVMIEAR